MPIKNSVSINKDFKLVEFLDTPKMSTYLLALVIGEFDYVQSKTYNNTLVRIITPLHQSNNGHFALNCVIKCLELYENWFSISYPLPKLDLIAVSEFEVGAMENWGLITFREKELLINENAGIKQKERVAYIVCHEVAHQWFGNLVTMKWWNELWLNESFATFIETLATDTLYPEFEHSNAFVSEIMTKALTHDGIKNSHPVDMNIYNAYEVDEIFDAISYQKGCSILRMFYQ